MSDGEVLDIRGEPCGMPVLRVERFIEDHEPRAPFTVLGDVEQTVEQLQLLAQRLGWTVELSREGGPIWRAVFTPR